MTSTAEPASSDQRPENTTVSAPGRLPQDHHELDAAPRHRGVLMTGHDGTDGPKAFYIHIEAKPDRVNQVRQMLQDILDCVQEEPATGP